MGRVLFGTGNRLRDVGFLKAQFTAVLHRRGFPLVLSEVVLHIDSAGFELVKRALCYNMSGVKDDDVLSYNEMGDWTIVSA